MARRYIGENFIEIDYHPSSKRYRGYIRAGKHVWNFSSLEPPDLFKYGASPESPSAYDEMAKAAVTFGSYFTSLYCGKRAAWAPPAAVADAIYQYAQGAIDPRGRYGVRRTRAGTARWK
jgi:hypothetical protein